MSDIFTPDDKKLMQYLFTRMIGYSADDLKQAMVHYADLAGSGAFFEGQHYDALLLHSAAINAWQYLNGNTLSDDWIQTPDSKIIQFPGSDNDGN